MIPALYIFIAMVVIGVILYVHDRMTSRSEKSEVESVERVEECDSPKSQECDDECCGAHEVCPSEMMLKHMNDPVVYYDDEELDAFKGRTGNEYTPDEVEQWRDVLYTLQHDDLMGWERSVKKRGIVMPEVIKEELISLINA